MKSFLDFSAAIGWFFLCVFAALVLLVVALSFNLLKGVGFSFKEKKITFPKLQFAK